MLFPSFMILTSLLTLELPKTEAIVEGTEESIRNFPSLVSLRNQSGTHYCAGTLVTRRHIVTSAQCLYEDNTIFYGTEVMTLKPDDVQIVVGANSVTEGGHSYKVGEFVPHPNHNVSSVTSLLYDIAVVVLTTDVDPAFATPVSLTTRRPKVGDVGRIAGWGWLNLEPQVDASVLQSLVVDVRSKEKCREQWQSLGTKIESVVPQIDEDNVFCAGPFEKSGAGVCYRDSGDPLFIEDEFVGIVVGADPCANGIPDLYTAVAGYKEFVESVINRSQ